MRVPYPFRVLRERVGQPRLPVINEKKPRVGRPAPKTDIAMVNETLCKILCHNTVVLIHEMCELGIDPVFWPNDATV